MTFANKIFTHAIALQHWNKWSSLWRSGASCSGSAIS